MIKIYDLGFAAYLKVVKLEDYSRKPQKIKHNNKNRFLFYFGITQEQLSEYRKAYNSSVFPAFDKEVKQLKQLLNE